MFFGEMYKFTWVTLIVIACLIISFTSDYTPSSSDGFDNNKLRNAAEQLYDNCQRYGKSFDPRC